MFKQVKELFICIYNIFYYLLCIQIALKLILTPF